METNLPLFSANPYMCNFCNIICSKKNDWDRHLLTNKHKKKIWKYNGNTKFRYNKPR